MLNFFAIYSDIKIVRILAEVLMTDSQFNFNRPYKPFGLNIHVPERTIKQAEETLEKIVKAPAVPLFNFLEENEAVFNGDLAFEINKAEVQNFNIGAALRREDEKINGFPPKFDMHF